MGRNSTTDENYDCIVSERTLAELWPRRVMAHNDSMGIW